MELLIEYEGSCREATLTLDNLAYGIVESVRRVAGSIFIGPHTGEAHFVQRWSSKWEKFVDVVSLTDVRSGDHLKVIVKPGCSSKDGVSCLLCRFLDPCPFKKRLITLGQILDRSTIKM